MTKIYKVNYLKHKFRIKFNLLHCCFDVSYSSLMLDFIERKYTLVKLTVYCTGYILSQDKFEILYFELFIYYTQLEKYLSI